jgi:hypothetical protein
MKIYESAERREEREREKSKKRRQIKPVHIFNSLALQTYVPYVRVYIIILNIDLIASRSKPFLKKTKGKQQ